MARTTIGTVGWMLRGAAAGAAGTAALDAVTYLDMAIRGRGASSTPEDTVEKLAEKAHVPIPGSGEVREHRLQGLGALTGLVAGTGVGALVGLARASGIRAGTLRDDTDRPGLDQRADDRPGCHRPADLVGCRLDQ